VSRSPSRSRSRSPRRLSRSRSPRKSRSRSPRRSRSRSRGVGDWKVRDSMVHPLSARGLGGAAACSVTPWRSRCGRVLVSVFLLVRVPGHAAAL
jgi:hypothetical protein